MSYTPQEFAELTGMRPNAVRRAIRNGEVKATRIGKLLYIPRVEVERFSGDAA